MWLEDGCCAVGERKLIDLHSMVLWGYYEVDLHDACIPFNCNLIALGYVCISHVQESFFISSGMVARLKP